MSTAVAPSTMSVRKLKKSCMHCLYSVGHKSHTKRGSVMQTLEELCFGPLFFNKTVTNKVYLKILQNDFMPQLEHIGEGKPLWFMHDGTLPHYTMIVQNWLSGNLENWIERKGTKVP